MTNQTNTHFIKIKNSLITEDSNCHLVEKELYLYSMLVKDMNIDREIKTTISLLNEFSNVKFASRSDNAVRLISKTLFSLNQKGLIILVNEDGEIPKSLKGNDSIRISIIETEEIGHTQVNFSQFEVFTTMSDYYIYCAVARWNNKIAKYSLDRWASILQCSRNSAIAKIEEAIKKGIIYKNIGDYKKGEGTQMKQEINLYSLEPFENEQKTNITKKEEITKANVKFREEHIYDIDISNQGLLNDKTFIFNTYKDKNGTSIFPDADDYLFYIKVKSGLSDRYEPATTLEQNFLEVAEKRIEHLKGNSKYKELFEEAKQKFLVMRRKEIKDLEVPKMSKRDLIGDSVLDEFLNGEIIL